MNTKEQIELIENDLEGIWANTSENTYWKFIKPNHTGYTGDAFVSNLKKFTTCDEYEYIIHYDSSLEKYFVVITKEDSTPHCKYEIDVVDNRIKKIFFKGSDVRWAEIFSKLKAIYKNE